MRIAYITAGAAGMYCGSCIHDNTLAAALMDAGHEVALVPTYTPTRTDEDDVSLDRVFYGAVNVWLEQRWQPFRRMPAFLHWLLDRPRFLSWISSRGVSVDARQLGAMTLAVLEGEAGPNRRELDELVTWLRDSFRPQIVHITNSMLLGMATPIKRELAVPVLCSLQGEDIFLEELPEPYRSDCRQKLAAHAGDVDAFVATSDYYAEFMSGYLQVPRTSIEVVRLGIKLEGHGSLPARAERTPFVVGYLARICPEKGLHLLAEGFRELSERVGEERALLKVAGYLGKRDERYFEKVRQRLEDWGLADRWEHVGEVSRDEKIAFLNSVDVLSVPTVYQEPKGLFALEAMANGVPVALPRHGALTELVTATGGGVLFEPGSTTALAGALADLMERPEKRRELGSRGREVVHSRYSDRAMADATVSVYRRWVDEPVDVR